MDGWLSLGGIVVASLLAFIFGRVNLSRASEYERSEVLRRQRLDVFAAFCVAVVQYRRAQLHRWFVTSRDGTQGPAGTTPPEVENEVRVARADAWAAYYQMVMLVGDQDLTGDAKQILALTRAMKKARSAVEVDQMGDEVHRAVDAFARKCLPQIGSAKGTR